MPQHLHRVRTEAEHRLVQQLSMYGDDTFINVIEVAALTCYSPHSIRQKKIRCLPPSDPRMKHLRWRLGDIRQFINASTGSSIVGAKLPPQKVGRPTKADTFQKIR